MDRSTLKEAFAAHGIGRVKIGGFDVDGVLRGKYVSVDKFWDIFDGGMGFCDVVFGWDMADVLYDNGASTGWHTGYPDTRARLDPTTFRVLPWEPGTAAFLIDFVDGDGRAHPACPRSLLKRIAADARALGYRATFAAEYEFFLFRESPEALASRNFQNPTPISPGMFGYSWVRTAQHHDVCHAVMEEMDRFGIAIEALHTETGPGAYEAALRYDDVVRMADNAALFKTALKHALGRFGLMPCFMAKWNAQLPGCGGHIHQSLWREDGPASASGSAPHANAFFDPTAPHAASAVGRSYVAGLLRAMADLTALVAPTVNSYKRYVPGVWAPLTASWGIENRTATIRWIAGSAVSTRLEHRQAGADANPYLAMAASLAAGLYGIRHGLAADPPIAGDAQLPNDQRRALPRTLRDATEALRGSSLARELLGEPFVEHFWRTREWEQRQYDRAVTDWELRRYFEAT
jgi:glutamine synthetase